MKVLLIILLTTALTACASYGKRVDRNYAEKLQKGVTTEAEVIGALGQPMSVSYNSNNEKTLHYLHVKSQAKAISFVPIVGLFAGGADTESTTFLIIIDKDTGLVKDWNYSQSNSSMDTGVTAN